RTRGRPGRPAAKTMGERIAATLAKLHNRRTQKREAQRKDNTRLKVVVGAAMTTTPKMPKTLTEPDFEPIPDPCFSSVVKALARVPAGQVLPPRVILGSIHDGAIAILDEHCPSVEDDDAKRALMLFMETAVQSPKIDFAVFIAEGWLLARPED